MKILTVVMFSLLLSARSFADVPVAITCTSPKYGVMLQTSFSFMVGIAQGTITYLAVADSDRRPVNYVWDVGSARPLINTQLAGGRTTIFFDYTGERSRLRSVQIVVPSDLETSPNQNELVSVISTFDRSGKSTSNEVLCSTKLDY